jgi:hypothetical protein
MKDLADQPSGRFVAFITTPTGERNAITCDDIAFVPGAVLFMQKSALNPDPKAPGIPVGSCAVDGMWYAVASDRFFRMTAEEYETSKIEDGKTYKEMMKRLFKGDEGVAQVVTMPSGKIVAIPATEEEAAAFRAGVAKEAKKEYEPGPGVFV